MLFVTDVRAQSITPSGPATFCDGGKVTLKAPGADKYQWLMDGSDINGGTGQNYNATQTGKYAVNLETGGKKDTTGTVLDGEPNPGVITPVHYCKGDAATALSATPAAGNTLFWYTQATGGAGDKNAPMPSTGNTGPTNSYVSQQNSYGCESGRADITVNVDAIPTASLADSADPASCASATGSITLKGLNANTTYQVAYTKNGNPVSISGVADNAGRFVIKSLSSGVYDNITVTLSDCASVPLGPATLSDPNPPAAPVAGADGPL